MKKTFLWMSLLTLVLMASCTYPAFGGGGAPKTSPGITPTLSDVQMQTQIPQLLTAMPTATGQAAQAVPTNPLPTVALATATQQGNTAATTYPAGATNTPVPPTATLAPTATTAAAEAGPTATTAANAAATTIPTVAVSTPGGATATAGPASGIPTVAVTPGASITQTQPSGPTFTPAPGDPRTRLGAPTSTDPMDRANTWIWPTGYDQYTEGEFGNGVQTITALTGTDGWRMANPTGSEFQNLYLEATFKVGACAANDHYGLYVRVPVLHEPNQGYLFGFTCDGRYSLRRWDGLVQPKGQMKWLIDWKKSTAIAAGSNQVNRMGIMMVSSRLILYANGKLLGEATDTSYAAGYFGVFLGSHDTPNFTIQVDEMSYWLNPQP